MNAALRLAVALVFLASAAAKTLDFDGTALLLGGWAPAALDPRWVRAGLALLVVLELAVAGALALPLRPVGRVLQGTMALLGVFLVSSLALAAAGAENCGCFGTWLSLSPAATALKNAVLLGTVALLHHRYRATAWEG